MSELASARIQAAIREQAPRGREVERIGPFLATFTRDTDNPFLNYAIPDDGASPSAADVGRLVASYRGRERRPRLEYIPGLAPAVEPVLLAAGFEVEGRLPLMTCLSAADARLAVPEGIELVQPRSEEEFFATASVQWEAYGERDAVPQRAVAGLRRTTETGGVVVLARDAQTGEPAGAGLCTAPHEGATELTSIGVRNSFRRRGIAAAMTAWLAREAFAKSMRLDILMEAGEAESVIYTRAGFTRQSEVLHISLSEERSQS
jgi:ribosomal protein S18 acetylase RimI-like enzyme